MQVQARYLGGESVLLPNCDTVGSIMVRIASEHQRFASDVVVFPLGADTPLTHECPPPAAVSVVLRKEEVQLDESECKTNIILHAKAGDASTVERALDMLYIAAPSTKWPEHILKSAARDAEKGQLAQILIRAGVDGALALEGASFAGDTRAVARLIDAGVPANAVMQFDQSALTRAALKGHRGVVDILLAARAHVNHADQFNESALTHASCQGHTDVVGMLLAARADVNHANVSDWSALTLASENKKHGVVEILLSAGAIPR
eukprot:GEMP01047461.1.p1 GENE.GEMP01047461.1~~GEMP01047461.1.p1  ORF type:complete len:263 (+),score=74.00 GEMP01047461.1:193-981(+)